MRSSLLALSTVLALTGCSIDAATLGSILSAVAVNDVPLGSTTPGAVASTAPGAPATTAPTINNEAVVTFNAKIAAAEADPRAIAKLFVAGMVAYEKNAELGRALMSLVVVPDDVVESPASPSGLDFINAREIYFRTFERNPALGRIYLDSPGAADGTSVESHVVIDDEYQAVEKGVNEEAGRANFFIKLNELGAGKRSRPISLQRFVGQWRVSEYSSLMVQI